MTLHVFTTQQKLDEIEQMIEVERRHTGRHNEVLRAIAADLRGRLARAPSVAMIELDRRICAVKQSRTALGYEHDALVGTAQEVIGRWPVIKQALEKFGAEIELESAQ